MQNNTVLSLPIDLYTQKIIDAFSTSPNVILTAPPGSGKTSRVPAALARELIEKKTDSTQNKIIVLVPKRIAALSAASRVAEENHWVIGQEVGYQVRFDHRTSRSTVLIFMTEGVFIKKINDPVFFQSIHTVVFDEFHERSSANDISLGYFFEKQILSESKIKILVMSATLNTEALKKYLISSTHVEVEIPPFALQIIKSKKAQRLLFDSTTAESICEVASEAWKKQKKDLLIFLPGRQEIRLIQNKLAAQIPNARVEVLHGSLRLEEQKKIIATSERRRIILSTNIAESSLTLPSVDCVIDSGLEKKAISESKIGFQRLELKRISLFSARQRAGRAARVGPGVCYQMWHESDERSMSEQIEPEIYKSSLTEEALTLVALGVADPDQFSWLTKPQKLFAPVLLKLKQWNLILENKISRDYQITNQGLLVQKCPLDLERSLLFVLLCQKGFKDEAALMLAFLESTDFSKITFLANLMQFDLNENGQRIEKQLQQFSFSIEPVNESSQLDFRITLFQIFLEYFPEKMAQRKEGLLGISSLGRGVQFEKHLVSAESDYFILLQGRDASDSTSVIQYALSYTQKEFETLSRSQFRTEIEYMIDFEKKQTFKQEKKLSGLFVVSVGTKTPLDLQKDKVLFKTLFKEKIDLFIENHSHSKKYLDRINFLKKKSLLLNYTNDIFSFFETLNSEVYQSLDDTISSLTEFLDFNLYDLLLYLTPELIRKDLQQLPTYLTVPSGKQLTIDYISENAPLVSVRIQDVLGLFKTPYLVDQKIPITFELLAPNYRPAQITNQLENFWQNSYFEVRKDLRARYPKHDWPDHPLDWRPEMSKRIKK